MSKEEWQIVPYDPSYRARVLGLMAEVQGHETTEAEFVWWFEQNPTHDVNIFLAVAGERVIGVSCHNTFLMTQKGKREVVSFPLNVLTHADFRGRGIFSMLEKANEAHAKALGTPFMLSFPNGASTPIFLNKLGWTRVEAPKILFRPRRLDRIFGAVKKLAPFASVARLGNPLAHLRMRKPAADLSIEPIERFDSWVDLLFAVTEAKLDVCIVRDARYLNWRFLDDPTKKYKAFKVLRGRTPVGYLVVGSVEKKGIRIGFLANGLMLPEIRHGASELRALAEGPLESLDADVWLSLGSPTEIPAAFLQGYWPFLKPLNFIYKNHTLPSQPHHWFWQLGDLDFF